MHFEIHNFDRISMKKQKKLSFFVILLQMYQNLQFLSKFAEICIGWPYHIVEQSWGGFFRN